MSTHSRPSRPNLEFYRKQAKSLLKSARAGNPDATARLRRHVPRLVGSVGALPANLALHDAQHAIAREAGFAAWRSFRAHFSAADETEFAARVEKTVAAVKAGDVEALRALLQADPALASSPDATDHRTPLVWAAMYGYNGRTKRRKPIVDLLLEMGADFNIFAAAVLNMPDRVREVLHANPSAARAVDAAGRTALHYAAEVGATEVGRLLVAAGADVNARDPHSHTPVHMASHPGPYKPTAAADIVEILESHGAIIDIHLAASTGDVPRLRRILQHEPSLIRSLDHEGATPLFYAAKNLHREAAELLLDAGADINARRPDGQTIVSTAVGHMWDRGGPEMVTFLRQRGALLDLPEAVKLADRPRIRQILAQSPDRIALTRWDESVLHIAALAGHPDIATELLAAGAPVDLNAACLLGLNDRVAAFLAADASAINPAKRYRGLPPLHLAAVGGHPATVLLLLDHGAEVNSFDEGGATPLHIAASHWSRPALPADADVARVLLNRGADPNRRDQYHQTALHICIPRGHLAVAQALLDHAADINAPDAAGLTPLHWAANLDTPDALLWLLDRGAAINAVDAAGRTAFHFAIEKNRVATTRALLARGANPDALTRAGESSTQLATRLGRSWYGDCAK